LEEDLIAIAMATMEDYLRDYSKWLINPLNLSKVTRLCYDRLLDMYIEQFLYSGQKALNVVKEFWPKYVIVDLTSEKQKKKDKKKKEDMAILTAILTNKDMLTDCLTRDMESVRKLAVEKHGDTLGLQYCEKMERMLVLLKEMLRIQQSDFEVLLVRVDETFKEVGKFIVDLVITIRGGDDPNFRAMILAQYDERFKKGGNDQKQEGEQQQPQT
jgi:hypothetical protein